MKILKKKEYDELIDRLDSRKIEIDELTKKVESLTDEKRGLQRVIGKMYQTIKRWEAKKIGNLRAVSELAKWFEMRHGENK